MASELHPFARTAIANMRMVANGLESVAMDLEANGLDATLTRANLNIVRRGADEFEAAELALLTPNPEKK